MFGDHYVIHLLINYEAVIFPKETPGPNAI